VTTVGRPKLREIAAHPQAFRHDPRARLYEEYLRYADAFQPLAVLIENVPDVLNHGGAAGTSPSAANSFRALLNYAVFLGSGGGRSDRLLDEEFGQRPSDRAPTHSQRGLSAFDLEAAGMTGSKQQKTEECPDQV